MKNFSIILILLSVTAISQQHFNQKKLSKQNPEALLPFTEYCNYYNYPVENHTITTKDGYKLLYFRIQAKGSQIKNGLPVVFLQHGLLDCSDTWIINSEDKAPAFLLANKGYDVWLGNSRGNKHSKNHVTLDSKNDKKYWDFSFMHMAKYDLPAAFEYIKEKTNQKINYIGHSQGTTQMFAALSDQEPSVVNNIKSFIAFGPAAYVQHTQAKLLVALANSNIDVILESIGINEFLPNGGWVTSAVGAKFCALLPKICGDLIASITSADPTLDNYDRYDVLAGHDPAGTSVVNMRHWKQFVQTGEFKKLNYGLQRNMQEYGQANPPKWNLSNIKMEVYLIAGEQDLLCVPQDVNRLKAELINSQQSRLSYYKAGHCTFVWGRDMKHMDEVYTILKMKNGK